MEEGGLAENSRSCCAIIVDGCAEIRRRDQKLRGLPTVTPLVLPVPKTTGKYYSATKGWFISIYEYFNVFIGHLSKRPLQRAYRKFEFLAIEIKKARLKFI
jgi:hypothetical protein